jgi:hypothetical protein
MIHVAEEVGIGALNVEGSGGGGHRVACELGEL